VKEHPHKSPHSGKTTFRFDYFFCDDRGISGRAPCVPSVGVDYEVVVNLTNQQESLLRFLVSNHESNGGKECYFTRSHSGTGASYPGGDSFAIPYDDTDLYQLQSERFISLTRISSDFHRGKPTQLGITLTQRGFAPSDVFGAGRKPAVRLSEDLPTVGDVEAALKGGERKRAVKLRCRLDGCTITALWKDAFSLRAAKPGTKRTAFNRWQASRKDAPSWADDLMRLRLLK
jgi:hypothetical protein